MNAAPKKWTWILVGLVAGLLIGGGVVVTAPSVAGGPAEVSKQILTKAGKPYYTKAQSNKRFYSKAKSDKRYYTKSASDTRYQPKAQVIRGTISLGSAPTSGYALVPIHWGISLDPAPTAHIITSGGVVPLGCSGTPAAPSASPGHLCIFERAASGYNARFVCSAVNSCGDTVSPFGAYYGATTTGNSSFLYGSWALGVGAFSTARIAPGGVSGAPGGPPGAR